MFIFELFRSDCITLYMNMKKWWSYTASRPILTIFYLWSFSSHLCKLSHPLDFIHIISYNFLFRRKNTIREKHDIFINWHEFLWKTTTRIFLIVLCWFYDLVQQYVSMYVCLYVCMFVCMYVCMYYVCHCHA